MTCGVRLIPHFCLPATIIQLTPTHAKAPIFARVRILDNVKPMTAATTTKTAVQTACFEMALSAIEMLSKADPETKVKTDNC